MHKYSLGQTVHFAAPIKGKHGSEGAYTITRLLPAGLNGPQYRLMSDDTQLERVAQEPQLREISV